MLPLGDGHLFLEAAGGLAAGWAPAPGQVPSTLARHSSRAVL